MITGDGGSRTLESRVFVEEASLSTELIRGGIPFDKLIIPGYGGQAYHLVRECTSQIVAAIFSEYSDAERVTILHRDLRRNNSNVKIYHLTCARIDHIEKLKKAGLVTLHVELLPDMPNGVGDRHPLYLLGKEFQQKYFTHHG